MKRYQKHLLALRIQVAPLGNGGRGLKRHQHRLRKQLDMVAPLGNGGRGLKRVPKLETPPDKL